MAARNAPRALAALEVRKAELQIGQRDAASFARQRVEQHVRDHVPCAASDAASGRKRASHISAGEPRHVRDHSGRTARPGHGRRHVAGHLVAVVAPQILLGSQPDRMRSTASIELRFVADRAPAAPRCAGDSRAPVASRSANTMNVAQPVARRNRLESVMVSAGRPKNGAHTPSPKRGAWSGSMPCRLSGAQAPATACARPRYRWWRIRLRPRRRPSIIRDSQPAYSRRTIEDGERHASGRSRSRRSRSSPGAVSGRIPGPNLAPASISVDSCALAESNPATSPRRLEPDRERLDHRLCRPPTIAARRSAPIVGFARKQSALPEISVRGAPA